jgi:hypothetical protein
MVSDKILRQRLMKLMQERNWSKDYTRRILGIAQFTLDNVLDVYGVMKWLPKTRDKIVSLLKQYEGK